MTATFPAASTPSRNGSNWRDCILLAHGGGGQLTDELLGQSVLPHIRNDILAPLLDAADLGRHPGRLSLTIDSFVVQPWRFPGGDIGKVAIAGTVNDLAVCGAMPVGVALGMIVAEGFPLSDLQYVMASVGATAREAGVHVVTGDTKVVGRGQADGIYLITAGIGTIPARRKLSPARVAPGDVLIINGCIGEHGLAVMLAREMPDVVSAVQSDVTPLNSLTDAVLKSAGNDVAFMRDPTRAGLSGLCADLAQTCGHRIVLEEPDIPVQPATRHAADLLGLDPLDIANEGKVVCVVKQRAAQRVLSAMKSHPLGRHASIIGFVDEPRDSLCELRTNIGGRRIVQKPYGEQLPRIC